MEAREAAELAGAGGNTQLADGKGAEVTNFRRVLIELYPEI